MTMTKAKAAQAIRKAGKDGDIGAIRSLMAEGVAPDTIYSKGHATALILAAEAGHVETVAYLLQCGADPEAKTEGGYTALHRAIEKRKIEVVALLAQSGANVEARDGEGVTPLMKCNFSSLWSPSKREREMAASLLDAGADPSVPSADWLTTPLHLAAGQGHHQMVSLFFEKSPKLDANLRLPSSGESPLHRLARGYAGATQAKRTLKVLREKGADIEALDNSGCAPLMAACEEFEAHRAGIALALLEAGADPNTANDKRMTPLGGVAMELEPKALKALLKAGADPNAKCNFRSDRGVTPLYLACRHYQNAPDSNNLPECVELLLKARADPAAANAKGQTPLDLLKNKKGDRVDKAAELLRVAMDKA